MKLQKEMMIMLLSMLEGKQDYFYIVYNIVKNIIYYTLLNNMNIAD